VRWRLLRIFLFLVSSVYVDTFFGLTWAFTIFNSPITLTPPPYNRDYWIWIPCCWESCSFHTVLHLSHPLSNRTDQNNSIYKITKNDLSHTIMIRRS
jgi:hypothetical protein